MNCLKSCILKLPATWKALLYLCSLLFRGASWMLKYHESNSDICTMICALHADSLVLCIILPIRFKHSFTESAGTPSLFIPAHVNSCLHINEYHVVPGLSEISQDRLKIPKLLNNFTLITMCDAKKWKNKQLSTKSTIHLICAKGFSIFIRILCSASETTSQTTHRTPDLWD